MSLLWVNAARHQAAPWHHDDRNPPPRGKPISVRKSGYAGHVGLSHDDEGDPYGENDRFDEDLYDESTPEPTEDEENHNWEHNEYPQSYYDRHDHAYQQAVRNKAQEDEPDHIDEGVGQFVREHAHSGDVWKRHGTYGKVDLKQPIYATQTHVHTGHLDRFDADPKDIAWHMQSGGGHNDYPANDDPLFATHEGRVHVVDGHHRVGAALRRGDPHINGWHIDLDHPKNSKLTDWDYDESARLDEHS